MTDQTTPEALTDDQLRAALDGVTACTGCGQCVYCQRKAADDAP